MGLYQRDALLNDLYDHVAEVTFVKLNGERRTLRCTLMANHLPPNYDGQHLDEMHKKEENKSVIAAWDIKAGGWKSFHVDAVEYVQILDNF